MRHPWYAYLSLALALITVSGGFFYVFGTVPKVGHWLRWVTAAFPIAIIIPFVVKRD